ncbi:MAG: hypothetical protein SVM79_06010, partial [Chloroflexota bacterium]|nr:hypothetical protein [Chloroflexota bacterium]
KEKKMMNFYAVDAGVQKAFAHFKNDGSLYSLGIGEHSSLTFTGEVNNRTVEVDIEKTEWSGTHTAFKIVSTSTDDNGRTFTAESSIEVALDYFPVFDNAISTCGDVNLANDSTINGDVVYGGNLNLTGTATINGTVDNDASSVCDYWPDNSYVSDYYETRTERSVISGPVTYSTMVIENLGPPGDPGAFQVTGGNLRLEKQGNNSGTFRLNGDVWVDGDISVGPRITLDLNNYSIYATGDIVFDNDSNIQNSGCIVAGGDISVSAGFVTVGAYVFFMSIEGSVTFNADCEFTGAVAGKTNVTGNAKVTVNYSPQPDGLSFPGNDFDPTNADLTINTYILE